MLRKLGTKWYLDFKADVSYVPEGHTKVISWMSLGAPSQEYITAIAEQAPGSIWYLHGEANRQWDYTAVVSRWREMWQKIKTADPTAKVTSPSMLNWEFTCTGCGGFVSGRVWMNNFRSRYKEVYGVEPEFDIWAIDAYPIDWLNLPTDNAALAIDQISSMYDYMQNIPEHAGKPIWITELSMHWGWSGMGINNQGLPVPAGEYMEQRVINYFATVYDWLEANSASKNIQRWFTFVSYSDLLTANMGAYAGASLFETGVIGSRLTPMGEYFKTRADAG